MECKFTRQVTSISRDYAEPSRHARPYSGGLRRNDRGGRTLLAVVTLAFTLGGCSLPSLEKRSISVAASSAQTSGTWLGQAVDARSADHPGESGFLVLANPHVAFATRAVLARAAERTNDAQYYIWRYE